MHRFDQKKSSNNDIMIYQTHDSRHPTSQGSRHKLDQSNSRLVACSEKDMQAYQKMNIKVGRSVIN